MSTSAHSWEAPEREWEIGGDIENSWMDSADDPTDGSADYWNVSPTEAGAKLYEFLLDLKRQHTLSAKQASVLAFWATRAGACGDAATIALPPTCQSGKFSSKIDKATGHPTDENYHYVDVPRHRRSSDERQTSPLAVLPPLDACVQHMQENEADLRRRLAGTTLPRTYYNHPVVQRAQSEQPALMALPLALYMDGVAYSREDSILGMWLVCMLTGRRWLLASLRRGEACKCGCRGWCSLCPLLSMLAWSLKSLARGRHPTTGHAAGHLDAVRQTLADQPLGFFGAVVLIKGDWCEYAHTLGFPTWSSIEHPCPLCCCTKGTAYTANGVVSHWVPLGEEGLDGI